MKGEGGLEFWAPAGWADTRPVRLRGGAGRSPAFRSSWGLRLGRLSSGSDRGTRGRLGLHLPQHTCVCDNLANAWLTRDAGSALCSSPGFRGARSYCSRSVRLPTHSFSWFYLPFSLALGPAPSCPANPRTPATPRPMRSLSARAPPRLLRLRPRSLLAFRRRVTCAPAQLRRRPKHHQPVRVLCASRRPRGQASTRAVPALGVALSGGSTLFTCALSTGWA